MPLDGRPTADYKEHARGRSITGRPVIACTSVNGAAAGWPRKVPTVRRLMRKAIGRQWGRGRMAAEGLDPAVSQVAGRLRQWGRGRMAAEGAAAEPQSTKDERVNGAAAGWPRKVVSPRRSHPRHPASMGPRPDGRGRARHADLILAVFERQWGRGRMAAEGTTTTATARRPCGVNGAAAGWPRKVLTGMAGTTVWLRQWGRGRMAAEGPASRTAPIAASGVNGAAAGWPRKGVGSIRPLSGPSRVNGAAAGWPRKEFAATGRSARMAASMGPRPDGRGMSCPASCTWAHT